MVLSGAIFGVLNALLRVITLQLPPIEAQFLRYVAGALVMLPFILRVGFRAYHPKGLAGQLWRGAAHTSGMLLWFMALPHLPLADTTAIGFTGPIFVMVGAVLVFHEPMLWRRWVSALIGFGGVLIVVWPKLSGSSGFYDLVMLGSAPLFAASQLITKALTKRDRTGGDRGVAVPDDIAVLISAGDAALGVAECGPVRLVPGRRRAGKLRALLLDAGVPRGGRVGDAAGAVPRPDLGDADGVPGVRRCANEFDAAGRAGDLRGDHVGRTARGGNTAYPLTVAPRIERA